MPPEEGSPYGRTMNELPARAEVGSPSEQHVSVSFQPLRDDDGNFKEDSLTQRAIAIFQSSTHYLEANIFAEWELNLAHFNSEHATNSKYRTKNYKRSRVFRPKTRANVKQQEAGLATAMFSTTGLVEIKPQDASNEEQVAAGLVSKELLQYRLEQRMPWELTVQGAFQDTKVYGLCISHQYWSLREKKRYTPAHDSEGQPMMDEEGYELGTEEIDIEEDELRCDLIAPENFRFDPMCDWRNPAGTSPYLIMLKPMRVVEAESMMEKNGGPWLDKERGELSRAGTYASDRIRYAREGYNRTDPADSLNVDGLTTVWAHLNVVREDSVDWIYWTMGTNLLLTWPKPLMEVEPWLRKGERPFVVGFSSVEAHKNYPAGDVQQIGSLQQEINEIANQRLDNVRLVLNKRFYVRRGKQINIGALVRSIPGGVVLVDDPETDIKEVTTPDITGSSYKEQEILAQETDELAGGFDAVKVAQDGASPGGIARAGATASAVRDYGVWLFSITWVEPVLRQLLRLEQTYEIDETILALAASKAKLLPRYGIDKVTDELLSHELILRVDASIGTMDPIRKVDRLNTGIGAVMQLPGMASRIKPMRVADEVFAALGFTNAEKFFDSEEEWKEKQAKMEPQITKEAIGMRELDVREADNHMRDEREKEKNANDAQLKQTDGAAREQRAIEDRVAKMEQHFATLGVNVDIADINDQTKRDIAAADLARETRAQNADRGVSNE